MGDHSNGLANLAEVTREFMYHQLVHRVLDHAGSKVQGLRSYAVLDWGFGMKTAGGGEERAGAIFRQAHDRAQSSLEIARLYGGDLGLPANPQDGWEVEKTLRGYGITSSGAHRDCGTDMVNVQMTGDNRHVLDFGAYRVMDEFPLRDVNSWLKRQKHLSASSPDYIQPDPAKAIPPNLWGVPEKRGAHADQVWLDLLKLTERYHQGLATREDLEAYVHSRMKPAFEALVDPPGTKPPGFDALSGQPQT